MELCQCGALIVRAKTTDGRDVVLNPKPVRGGRWYLSDEGWCTIGVFAEEDDAEPEYLDEHACWPSQPFE